MKKLLLLFLLAAMPVCAQTATFNPIGKWQATDDDGQVIVMTFDKEGYITMQRGNEVIGGKSFEMEGIKASMKYTFNAGGIANHVDFTITETATNEEHTLMGIYKVIGPDEIAFNMDNMERPADAGGEGSITFKKVK
jgi:hypothetical protein